MTRLSFSFRLVLSLLFILCLIASNSSKAGQVAFHSFASVKPVQNSVSAIVRFKYAKAANDVSYYRKVVQISKASAVNVIRRRAFSPWGAFATVAITAAGFLIDQDTGEIKKPATVTTAKGYWTRTGPGNGCCFASSAEAIDDLWAQVNYQYCYTLETWSPETIHLVWGCGASGGGLIQFHQDDNYADSELTTPESIATDDELYDAVKDTLSPGQWRDVFINPETGALEPEIQTDIEPTRQQLETDLNNQYDADPNNDPVTVPEEELDSEQDTNDEPDDYEVQFDEPVSDDGLSTYDIPALSVPSQGSYSCPANPTITTSKGTFDLNIQPTCNGLISLRPVIIAVFFLISAYIVVGVKRSE